MIARTSSTFEHFVKLGTCTPTLMWQERQDPEHPVITYDVAVYTALGGYPDLKERGLKVFYVEDLPTTAVTVQPALNPNTIYFWSVRTRLPDGHVSNWLTYDKTSFVPGGIINRHSNWFGVKTPKVCS
jgi:hypothetical protein